MAQITNCLKLISRINEGDQDSLISRIDELQALGVPAQRAQVQAAIDVLARLQREAGGIQRSAKRDVTDTPEFKRWFGDSEAVIAVNAETGDPVTSSGEPKRIVPLVMYHTTRNDFREFEVGRPTKNSGTFGDWETQRHAVFVTPDIESSQAYGTSGGKFLVGANVMPLYVKAENPLDLTSGVSDEAARRLEDAGMSARYIYNALGSWEMFDDDAGKDVVDAIKAAGYDSVIFNDENPDTGEKFESWALFSPTQIKSAIGNNGQFDSSNPDITRSAKRDITETPEFKAWFGNSKVVDADGKPLVVYHGTPNVGFTEFDVSNVGTFFSDRFDVAASYAGRYNDVEFDAEGAYTDDGTDQGVYAAYLAMRNPLVVDWGGKDWGQGPEGLKLDDWANRAKRAGRDGLVVEDVVDAGWRAPGLVDDDGIGRVYVAFRPEQIKSATGNRGTFDPADADITRSAKRDITETPEFKAWFGDSKVVDSDGKPLVVYHGTTGNIRDFKSAGGNLFWVTPSHDLAASLNGRRRKVLPLYVKSKNPFDPHNESHVALIADQFDRLYGRSTFSDWRRRIKDHWKVWDDFRARNIVMRSGFDSIWSEEDGVRTLALIGEDVPSRVKSANRNNGQFDPDNPDITRSTKRSRYAWSEREDTADGPVLRGDGFYLLPQREIAQDDFGDGGFGENGLLGHAERVVPGTRTFAFRIVGDDGKLAGVLVSDVDETGALRSIHDIEIDAKRSGLGSKIVATIAANTSEPIKIQDITNEADPFWTRIGVGYKDPYGNASLDWEDVAQYVGSRAAAPVDQDWTFAQDGSRGLSPDSYEVRELSPEELEGIQFSTKRNDLGFYSALERGIEGMQTKQAPAGAWKTQIKGLVNKGIVKQDEVTWSGLEDWLDLQEGKVSKEAISEYLRQGGVQVQEVTLGVADFFKSSDEAIAYLAERYGMTPDEVREEYGYADDRDYIDLARSVVDDRGDQSKYGNYTLPGGSQYREVLITLPDRVKAIDYNSKEFRDAAALQYGEKFVDQLSQYQRDLVAKKMQGTLGKDYRSSHWDQKNVLTHIRVNDRVDADGRKVLFVEEIQSDFQQDYRKSKSAIKRVVESDFLAIVERMKKAGVLEVVCD